MSTPYLGSIMLVAFNFAPKNFAFCNGQLLSISQNEALFALLGTTYGGNGTSTFALPNLQSRVAVHNGNGYVIGGTGGTETVALTVSQMPAHTHSLTVSSSSAPLLTVPNANTTGSPGQSIYSTTSGDTMNAASTSTIGSNQAHDNHSPYLVLNYVIALSGIFPSRN